MIEEIAIILSDDETFDQTEAPRVLCEYVCGVCNGELSILFARSHWRVLVVCPEHGNVSKCGRVMRSTVSMEMERALSKFNTVIRNLPDLWGELLEKRLPPREGENRRQQNIRELGF
jgi:hypothetical protein